MCCLQRWRGVKGHDIIQAARRQAHPTVKSEVSPLFYACACGGGERQRQKEKIDDDNPDDLTVLTHITGVLSTLQ